jgi:hypothetical protein
MGYVAYWVEHLRDGEEEGAVVFSGLPAALYFLTAARNEWFAADNFTFRLFELGKELPLEEESVMEQPPPKVGRRVIKLKQGG